MCRTNSFIAIFCFYCQEIFLFFFDESSVSVFLNGSLCDDGGSLSSGRCCSGSHIHHRGCCCGIVLSQCKHMAKSDYLLLH